MHLRSRIQPTLPSTLTGEVYVPVRPRRSRMRTWLFWTVVISLLLHALALLVIFFQPHTDLDQSKATAPQEWQIETQPDKPTSAPPPSTPSASKTPGEAKPMPPQPKPPAPQPAAQPQSAPPLSTSPEPPQPVPPAVHTPPVLSAPKAETQITAPPKPAAAKPTPKPSQQASQQANPFAQLPKSSDFFQPRNAAPPPPPQTKRNEGGLNLALGKVERFDQAPASRHQNDVDSDVQISGAEVGPDWVQQLHVWWIDHRRYPEEAIRNDQSGEVVIRFDIDHQGQTSNAEILKHSGSQWLDAQTMATFGHSRLPPLPPTTPEDHATITITVRYTLY